MAYVSGSFADTVITMTINGVRENYGIPTWHMRLTGSNGEGLLVKLTELAVRNGAISYIGINEDFRIESEEWNKTRFLEWLLNMDTIFLDIFSTFGVPSSIMVQPIAAKSYLKENQFVNNVTSVLGIPIYVLDAIRGPTILVGSDGEKYFEPSVDIESTSSGEEVDWNELEFILQTITAL